jgi:hypothetical protein
MPFIANLDVNLLTQSIELIRLKYIMGSMDPTSNKYSI